MKGRNEAIQQCNRLKGLLLLLREIDTKYNDKMNEREKETLIRFQEPLLILPSLALPCTQFVDDVEFWFPPGKGSIVEYRSASRLGNFDFDVNRKRIKVKLHNCYMCFLYCYVA
jgi:hypothetical protein